MVDGRVGGVDGRMKLDGLWSMVRGGEGMKGVMEEAVEDEDG